MKKIHVYLSVCLLIAAIALSSISAQAENNIEFLEKSLIKTLNSGIFEVVTPKLEGDVITYARELPFDTLDYVERNEKYYSIGTAFFISDTQLMTAAHVFHLMYFSLYHDFYIRDAGGNVFPVGNILKHSTLRDMVVFDLKKYPANIVPLKLGATVDIGDTVFSVGNAQGEGIAYRAGQVASFTPEREYGKWKNIRFTSPASPGNSGGPLLDLLGRVVGVIVQKNQSENYNIAIPLSELDHLGTEAVFHQRNVKAGIYGVDDIVSKDWHFIYPLPTSVGELAKLSQDSLNAHFIALNNDLQEKVKERNYPLGIRFRDYLRNQPYVKGLAPLLPGKGFRTWRAIGGYGDKIPISSEQNVYRRKGLYANLHVVVEKPPEVTLTSFIQSPRLVMDNLLKAIPFSRQIGTEKINITSLGEPVQTRIVTDKLGRKWTSALWELPYRDGFVHSSCLPYPGGVICLVDSKQNGARKYGYFDTVYDGYNEISVGYQGSIKSWQQFFNLGKKYLGSVFSGAKVQLDGHRLQIRQKGFSLDFVSDNLTQDSSIHLHMGYDNAQVLAEDLLLFELIPVQGSKLQYRIQPFFEPGVFSSDSFKATWKQVVDGNGEFSGKAVNKGDKFVIRKGVDSTKTTVSSGVSDPVTRLYAWGCFFETSAKNMEERCADFTRSIHFLSAPQ